MSRDNSYLGILLAMGMLLFITQLLVILCSSLASKQINRNIQDRMLYYKAQLLEFNINFNL